MTHANSICPQNANISWIIHGWLESIASTEWIGFVKNATLKEARGCVILMDYSYYSKQGYYQIARRFYLLRDVLANAVNKFGNYDRMHFFGFSFGARIAIGLGNNFTAMNNGTPVLPRMDLCDPAGPYFYPYEILYQKSQTAAKNVACMHTSIGYGTAVYDCHQNYRMGYCAWFQYGQRPFPKVEIRIL